MTSHFSNGPEILRFGYGETGLGFILVAASSAGVAALFIGSDVAKLERDLTAAFPDAECVSDQAGLAEIIAKASALIDAPHRESDLKLDLRGSALEIAVWRCGRSPPARRAATARSRAA